MQTCPKHNKMFAQYTPCPGCRDEAYVPEEGSKDWLIKKCEELTKQNADLRAKLYNEAGATRGYMSLAAIGWGAMVIAVWMGG